MLPSALGRGWTALPDRLPDHLGRIAPFVVVQAITLTRFAANHLRHRQIDKGTREARIMSERRRSGRASTPMMPPGSVSSSGLFLEYRVDSVDARVMLVTMVMSEIEPAPPGGGGHRAAEKMATPSNRPSYWGRALVVALARPRRGRHEN